MTMSMYSSYTPEDFNTEDDIFGKFINLILPLLLLGQGQNCGRSALIG